MSRCILLRRNSPGIRRRIEKSGISVCMCAGFDGSVWLDYYPENDECSVHGIGYPCECGSTDGELSFFEYELKMSGTEVIDCVDVDEFIEKIKEYRL